MEVLFLDVFRTELYRLLDERSLAHRRGDPGRGVETHCQDQRKASGGLRAMDLRSPSRVELTHPGHGSSAARGRDPVPDWRC
jgi:hypothetical protein